MPRKFPEAVGRLALSVASRLPRSVGHEDHHLRRPAGSVRARRRTGPCKCLRRLRRHADVLRPGLLSLPTLHDGQIEPPARPACPRCPTSGSRSGAHANAPPGFVRAGYARACRRQRPLLIAGGRSVQPEHLVHAPDELLPGRSLFWRLSVLAPVPLVPGIGGLRCRLAVGLGPA
jgi:hypothetical protein